MKKQDSKRARMISAKLDTEIKEYTKSKEMPTSKFLKRISEYYKENETPNVLKVYKTEERPRVLFSHRHEEHLKQIESQLAEQLECSKSFALETLIKHYLINISI